MNTENTLEKELSDLTESANTAFLAFHAATMFAPKTAEFNRLREVNDDLRKAVVRAKNHLGSSFAMDSVNERIAWLMHEPSVSDWLKRAIPALLTRDAVDAARDAKILANLMLARAEASNK